VMRIRDFFSGLHELFRNFIIRTNPDANSCIPDSREFVLMIIFFGINNRESAGQLV
jgi:hypothetical protein